ncbi:MAG: AAA family ATPase, partial [Desulfobacter sp.]|uniref:helix-turn-helix domain-containing protein n=1 Tax=Desulfobacter sp. TaxID=2294 RepID=UPI001B57E8F8
PLTADRKSIRETETALDNDEYAALPLAELVSQPLKKAVLALERFRLSQALKAARFNQKEAAANLGISYDQLRALKKKHGM